MVFVKDFQDIIIDRFDGTCDKQAAGVWEGWQILRMFQEMFNLDGHVICQVWPVLVEGLDDWNGMDRPMKKSGFPKVICRAPASICVLISSNTTSRWTTRNRPSYTGTMGQWRHKCLQPRLASV